MFFTNWKHLFSTIEVTNAAMQLDVTRDAIYKWIQKGKVPFKYIGKISQYAKSLGFTGCTPKALHALNIKGETS